MNDRFKFRLFCKSRNKMYKVHCLHIGTNEAVVKEQRANCSITLNNSVLMQCTGLKDKNGTLIYEGDIIKGAFDDGTLTVIRWSKKDLTWCADFSQVYGKAEYSYYVALADYDSKNLEVIGNIYENPELLGGAENEN